MVCDILNTQMAVYHGWNSLNFISKDTFITDYCYYMYEWHILHLLPPCLCVFTCWSFLVIFPCICVCHIDKNCLLTYLRKQSSTGRTTRRPSDWPRPRGAQPDNESFTALLPSGWMSPVRGIQTGPLHICTSPINQSLEKSPRNFSKLQQERPTCDT